MLFLSFQYRQRNWSLEVIKEAFIDKTDLKKRFVAVQVKFKKRLKI